MNLENRKEIPLWNGEVPLALENDTEHLPTVTPYFPAVWKRNGKAVVIFPGGAYAHLADHEGRGYAEFLASKGYCCFVVKYRLGSNGYHHPAELADAARGVRFVRSLAAELGIRPNAIGVMGSSAGGHLAAHLGNCYSEALYAGDEDKAVSSRPDWMLLCYPVITFEPPFANVYSGEMLMGTKTPDPELAARLSCENTVTGNTPPAFIWHTGEDNAVPVENSLMYAAALRKNGVPFELHIYEKGPHGTGLFEGHPWAEEAVRWMEQF